MTNAPEGTVERTPTDVLDLMAVGRLILAVTSLTMPRRFARSIGVRNSPELTYMTRIYGARALVMGLGQLTGGPIERARWTRFGLVVDIADTLAGFARLVRRDVPLRAVVSMIVLTGCYAVVGAREVVSRGCPDAGIETDVHDAGAESVPCTASQGPNAGGTCRRERSTSRYLPLL